jgi:hypothetical protein
MSIFVDANLLFYSHLKTARLKPVIQGTGEAEIKRIVVQDQLGQKSSGDSHLNKWLGAVVCTFHPSYTGKHKHEDHCPGQPRHKARTYLKID